MASTSPAPLTKASTRPASNAPLTGEELYAMDDIGPAELVKGKLVHQMPTGHSHGRLEASITGFLFLYLQQHNIGHLLTGEVGIYTQRDPDTVRAVDAAFISHERYAQVQSDSYLDICPELLIEVLSPHDSWSVVQEKLAEYFAVDARMIWVFDPRLEQIHVYRSLDDVTRITKDGELSAPDILPGFQIEARKVFNIG